MHHICLYRDQVPTTYIEVESDLSSQVIKSESTSYDVSFKLKAVKCSAKKTKEAAAREIGVDAKRMFN